MTSSHIATYVAMRSYAYTRSAASSSFGKCFASHESIGKRARQSVPTVKRNIRDLEKWGLLYRAGWRGRTREVVPVDHPERFQATVAARGLDAAKADETAHLEAIHDEARGRLADLGHRRPTKNKRPAAPDPYPIPQYIPFDRREPRSSATPTGVISDQDQGHGRPTKNDLEERSMKNTPQPPVEGALIESDSPKNNGEIQTTSAGADPAPPAAPTETQEEKLARLRERMRADPDFNKVMK